MSSTNGVETRKPGLLTPLDKAHQDAFVTTVRGAARAGIFVAFGVVLGVAFAWASGLRTRSK